MSNYYLYCVTNGLLQEDLKFEGIESTKIQMFQKDDICVLYSRIEKDEINQTLENMKSHNQIMLNIMEKSTVIPFQFGTIMKSEKEIVQIIEKFYDQFKENLIKVSGKAEMGIKLFGEAENQLISKPKNYPALNRLKSIGEEKPSINFLIERLGLNYEEKMRKQQINDLSDKLLESLLSLSCDSKITIGKSGRMLINSSFLVERENIAEFEKRARQIRVSYPQYLIVYSGPWPPYNFVKILKEGEKSERQLKMNVGAGLPRPSERNDYKHE